jgi:hypothetical protein
MANEHNTVTWSGHTLTASDGNDYYIVSGTTTTDYPVTKLTAGILYYIYWDETSPYKYSTIIASGWASGTPAGKHIISEVTGQVFASHPGVVTVANIEYKTDVPATTGVNITTIANQDSLTAETISNIGTTATAGTRLKMNTPGINENLGADAGSSGTDAERHWIRGYTTSSSSDTGGRWLDIDGYAKAITIRDGAATDKLLGKFDETGISFYDGSSDNSNNGNILSGFNATGMKFYRGTQNAASNATTISHYAGTQIKYFNQNGFGDTNLRMMIDSAATTGYDGSLGEGVTFYNDTGYIVLSIDANGVTFFNGTISGTQNDDIVSKWTATELLFFTEDGSDTEDRKVRIGMGATAGITLFGTVAGTETPTSTFLQFQSAPAGSENTLGLWSVKAYQGLWRHNTVIDDYLLYVPKSDVYIISNNLDGTEFGGGRIRLEASSGLGHNHNGWAVHSSSAAYSYPATEKHYNFFYPYNHEADLFPNGDTVGEPYNYIGYYNPDLRAASGTVGLAASITAIACYYFNGGYGSALYPSHTFTYDPNTGMYRAGSDIIGFSAGGTGRLAVSTTAVYPISDAYMTLGLGGGSAYNRFRDAYIQISTTTSGTNVVVSATGQLIRDSSSIRYKNNVKSLDLDISKLSKLRPVSFNYKSDNASNIGLIAEEVDEVLPELINYNEDGQPDSIRFNGLTVMLLEKVRELDSEIQKLKEKN